MWSWDGSRLYILPIHSYSTLGYIGWLFVRKPSCFATYFMYKFQPFPVIIVIIVCCGPLFLSKFPWVHGERRVETEKTLESTKYYVQFILNHKSKRKVLQVPQTFLYLFCQEKIQLGLKSHNLNGRNFKVNQGFGSEFRVERREENLNDQAETTGT